MIDEKQHLLQELHQYEHENKALEAENKELKEAMQRFVDKVESGRARSKETYSEFKQLLERHK